MKKSISIFFRLSCILASFATIFVFTTPVQAKKDKTDDFSISKKKYKPQNLKIAKRLWSVGLKSGGSKKHFYPEYNNPVADNGVIYVGSQGGIFYAVSESSGKILWKYKNVEAISSTPALNADRIFFTDLGGGVVCLSKSDGSLVWRNTFDREMLGLPLVSGGNLYLLRGEQDVIAVSQDDGHLVWSRAMRTYLKDITMRGHSSLALVDGALVVGLADGHLYKIAPSDGRVLWDKNLSLPLKTFKDIDAQVVQAGDSLYVGGYFGSVYRLGSGSGNILWSSDVATSSRVLVQDNMVVISDVNGSVVGLDRNSGEQIWFNNLSRGPISDPVFFAGKVFVTAFDKGAYLLDLNTGNQVQKLDVGTGALNSPFVSGDKVFIVTNDAKLVAFTVQ